MAESITLKWNNRKHRKTIPIDPVTNVATFNSAPGFKNCIVYSATIEESEPLRITKACKEGCGCYHCMPRIIPFEIEDTPNTESPETMIEDRYDPKKESTEAEFLRIHQKLGHLPPIRIQKMAKSGALPKRLAHCQIPKCTACLFGKATTKLENKNPSQ